MAVPKVGSVCATQGKIRTYQGVKFVCMKIKGKLIWGTSKVPTQNLATFKPDEVLRDYFSELRKNTKQTSEHNIVLNRGPRLPLEFGVAIEKSARQASLFFQNFMKLDENIELVLMTPSEENYFRSWVTQHAPLEVDSFMDWFLNSPTRATAGRSKSGVLYIFFSLLPENWTKNTPSARKEVVAGVEGIIFHEMAHVFQSLHTGESGFSCTPCWLIEGQAEAFTNAFFPSGEYAANRFQYIEMLRSFLSQRDGVNSSALKNVLRISDSETNPECEQQRDVLKYALGRLINEKLLEDFGVDQSVKLMTLIGKMTWDKAFLNSFGVAENTWIEKSVIPYLLSELKNKQKGLGIEDAKALKKKISQKNPPLPPPSKSEVYVPCRSETFEESEQKGPGIIQGGHAADSKTSGKISIVSRGIKSLRVDIFKSGTEDLHYSSGIINETGPLIEVYVSGLICGTSYRVKTTVYSELDGLGKNITSENDGQLRTFDC